MNKSEINKLTKPELVNAHVKLNNDYAALAGRQSKLVQDNKKLVKGKDELSKDLVRVKDRMSLFIQKNGIPTAGALFWVFTRPFEIVSLVKDLIEIFKYKQDA